MQYISFGISVSVGSFLGIESKENNLNYLEIFSSDLDECVKMILDKIKEIKGDSN